MRAKFDFAADFTILCRNVSDGQRGDLTDAQSRENGERESERLRPAWRVVSMMRNTRRISVSVSTLACAMTTSIC